MYRKRDTSRQDTLAGAYHHEQIVSRATKPLGAMDGLYLWRPPSIFAMAAS
jgi:hypothetical protein